MKLMRFLSVVFLTVFCLASYGQAKKPTLMVVPSEAWCKKNGFIKKIDNQGTTEEVADYKEAVSTDMQLNAVISKINNLMADRGFPLKYLQAVLKSINNNNAELSLIQGKASGASIVVSPLDQLRRTAKADITLELEWFITEAGPKKTINFNLKGLDSYTNKQVAGADGVSKPSFAADIPVLLAEAVQDHMDLFCERLQNHFDDMLENGREISLEMHIFDSAGYDFEEEFGGDELNEVIDNWLSDNCVNHRFNKSDATETSILYEQVRIPLYKENGQAMDTYAFARNLAKYLKEAPYNLIVKTTNQGLGKCVLSFGEK